MGTKLALAVITRLLKKDDSDTSGTILLEVCRGLWALSALMEKKATDKIEAIDTSIVSALLVVRSDKEDKHSLLYVPSKNSRLVSRLLQTAQMEELNDSLETRLSVAGAASSAVQQLNDNERSAFQQSCFQRRQEALNSIAWDFRNVRIVCALIITSITTFSCLSQYQSLAAVSKLLCAQQQVLTKMQVPGFDGPTVDANTLQLQSRLCSYLHSAFYLRARIGEAPHQTMLKSQAERLKSELASQPETPQPSEPSLPPLPPPPPPFPLLQMPPQPMYSPAFPQYSQQSMAYAQQFPGPQIPIMPQGVQQPPNMQYGQPQQQYYQHQQQ